MEIRHRCTSQRDIYRRRPGRKLTGDAPMPYKMCGDFLLPLRAGDQLDFRVGEMSAGMFQISDLPNNDALMLLVIERHDTLTTAVSFKSHVFANLLNAQVAVIDAYKGPQRGKAVIMDKPRFGSMPKANESLRFNGVVAIQPGLWQVALMGDDGAEKGRSDLVALNRESYVILRVGVDAQHGTCYPPELVVYPVMDVSRLTADRAKKSIGARDGRRGRDRHDGAGSGGWFGAGGGNWFHGWFGGAPRRALPTTAAALLAAAFAAAGAGTGL